MQVHFIEPSVSPKGILVLGVDKDHKLTKTAKELDAKHGHFLTHFLDQREKKDKLDEPLCLTAPVELKNVTHVILVGEVEDVIELGGKVAARANPLKKDTVTVLVESVMAADKAAEFAYGYKLRSWSFDKYITKEDRKNHQPKKLDVAAADVKSAEKTFTRLNAIYESVVMARELSSEPANVLYPESYANRIKAFEKEGLEVEIYNAAQLEKMGFNTLLGVAQGSVHEARFVVLQWHGGKKGEAPLAIVGKGVTFDSGGISIKPANKMEDMKHDMGGSAVVAGVLHAVAKNKVKANVIGVMGLVENMPSGSAQRPGDIVKSLSGQTVEVINTDAEGRLVLADALWYTQERFKPKYMVDLATLTGAIVVALGYRYAGLFSNHEGLAQSLQAASATTKEKIWPLPMDAEFAKAIRADQADVKNSDYGVGAGSITAAQFLEYFVNKTPWAHLDIAGTVWSTKASNLFDKGATGFGVRLLYQWIEDQVH